MIGDKLRIHIVGVPIALQRARVGQGRVYTPPESRAWKRRIAEEVRLRHPKLAPAVGPVRLSLEFAMPIPPSWSERAKQGAHGGKIAATSRPDLDNLAKAVLDALNGIAWRDDAQVVELSLTKIYSLMPGVEIVLEEIDALRATGARKG